MPMYLLKYRTMNKFSLHFWLLWILSIKGDSLETVVDKEPGTLDILLPSLLLKYINENNFYIL